MEATVLFDRVSALWPDAIVLRRENIDGDGEPLWSLVHTYEAIEDEIDEDEWLELGIWAFHQALTDIAEANLSHGKHVVLSSSVSLAAFDNHMRANLADESWASEREMYVSPDSR